MSPARARLEQAERELQQATNPAVRTLLGSEIAALRVDVSFDELVAAAPEGPKLAAAREQLRTLDAALEAGRRDPRAGLAAIIELAIHHGAPIYNEGSRIGCAYIYDYAARMIHRMVESPAGRKAGLQAIGERLLSAGFGPITAETANLRAWELRHAFDDIIEGIQAMAAAPGPSETAEQLPRILISYRREDAAPYARLMYERLMRDFGKRVFLDIESIAGGDNFHARLQQEVATCGAMVVVIGKGWVGSSEGGKRRIDHEGDFVRMEVQEALRREIRVVPVLVGGAQLPGEGDLPECLRELARRQAVEISDLRMDYDLQRLVDALRQPMRAGLAP